MDYRAAVPRAAFDVEAAVPAVHEICEAVRTRGLEAILEIWPAPSLGVADRGIREGILRSLMARDGYVL